MIKGTNVALCEALFSIDVATCKTFQYDINFDHYFYSLTDSVHVCVCNILYLHCLCLQ